ncbi:MAG: MiaB/RimO family radical SAM methylthiotransferase [Spirochaetaceae bacterium]|nr:MAG: MiaB/RimO family radical SAM methylthiotransferase [Spirochaetaceae bacterium]
MNYCLVPLGCQMNQSDTERIRTVLEAMGYRPTDREEEADLLGIVACSVRQKAIDKVYAKIHKWNEWKLRKNLLTFVSGCILPADREKFLKRFDLLFTINELPHLPDMIRQYGVVTPAALAQPGEMPEPPQPPAPSVGAAEPETPAPRVQTVSIGRLARRPLPAAIPDSSLLDETRGFWHIEPSYSSSFEAFVPIQNGCDKFCTFCAVPYTRGREVSRPSTEILHEVTRLADAGYRCITLLGQNVNSYGLDRRSDEIGFPELLRRIGRIGAEREHPFRLYFTSPHPHDMTDEVIDVIAEYPCLGKQIHLPMQSGDDKVLIRMNRNYRIDGYRRVVEAIRRTIPEATLFTDIIVGFTGETEAQFQNTVSAMREFAFNMAYVAMYSPRPGAASSRWADDVPLDEKKRRLHLLSEVLQETSGAYNRNLVGSRVRVLVDGTDRKPGFVSTKTEGRLIVRVADPGADAADGTPAGRGIVGSLLDVEITAASPLSMEGRIVDPRAVAPAHWSAGSVLQATPFPVGAR